MSNKKIVIIGAGPSGLIAANCCQDAGLDFTIFAGNISNFYSSEIDGIIFNKGQRTLFWEKDLHQFIQNTCGSVAVKNLSDLVSVFFKGKLYDYPIQNATNIEWHLKWKMYWDYIFRNKKQLQNNNYVDFIEGTYGKFLAKNVILPHTWKTMKEDLWNISAGSYGKKVLPMKVFGKKEDIKAFCDEQLILDMWKIRIKPSNAINQNVESIEIFTHNNNHLVKTVDSEYPSDIVINTIPITKLLNLLKNKSDMLDMSQKSLCYNDMMLVIMIVPTSFINCQKEIIYFPEREYIFSKVNIKRNNGMSAIVSELSFRMNEKEKLTSKLYCQKIYEKVEDGLKRAKIMPDTVFSSFHTTHEIISPAYIICDAEYEMHNNLINTYLEHQNLFNVGRFAQWKPHMRVEHSLKRVKEIINGL